MQQNRDRFQMILAMIIFGTIGIIRTYIPFPSSVIALVRGIVGSVFLLLIHFYRKEHFSREAIKKNLLLLSISGILLGTNWIFLFEAYQYTTISVATMSYYMAPVFVILASPICLHEKLTLRKGICSIVAVMGMILVSGITETSITGMVGILFGLGAAIMYAAVILLNKFIKDLSANERTIFQLGVAAIAILPYVLLTENIYELKITPFILVMLLVAGIVHTGIAYALYFGSIKTIPAQTVALFSYIDPIVAVVLSVILLKEKMSVSSFVGIVMVLGSMIACEFQLKSNRN